MKKEKYQKNNPTCEFYKSLQRAYEFFNKRLFDSKLPNCMITVQREKNTMGYFSPERWVDKNNNKIHEISLNPAYFAEHKIIEIFQTLVHEMCHLWQYELGMRDKKRPRTYHDSEWAKKMESIGLQPVAKGSEKTTGQTVSDKLIPEGKFELACIDWLKQGNVVKWIDRYPAVTPRNLHLPTKISSRNFSKEDTVALNILHKKVNEIVTDIVSIEQSRVEMKNKRKSKYTCDCSKVRVRVWGKSGISIICGKCKNNFKETKI